MVLIAAGALVVFVLAGGLRPVAVSLVAAAGAFGFLAVGIGRSARSPRS
ncbi:MAG: hypothetical protein ACE14W_05665 [Candidatus Velamenicoccus archaeovorus]